MSNDTIDTTPREPIVFDPVEEHEFTIIFVHGLGDSAETWTIPVESWRRNGAVDNVKFILPNSPIIPLTANCGGEMPAWFDIRGFDGTMELFKEREDSEGIDRSKDYLQGLIQE